MTSIGGAGGTRRSRCCTRRSQRTCSVRYVGTRASVLGRGSARLWHVSEDPTLRRFEPHLRPGHDADEPFVWAIDTRHLPLYWFPRDCPRATFRANGRTSDEDVERFLEGDRGRRVHVIEPAWLERIRAARVVAYRMPEAPFERRDRFWVSRSAVEPLELVE